MLAPLTAMLPTTRDNFGGMTSSTCTSNAVVVPVLLNVTWK